MNFAVEDPEWGWWIILYFYLGGLAAGSYFMAALIDLMGSEEDAQLPRIGYFVAFPLTLICGLLLIVDLHVPGRFWHMLFRSEVVKQALAEGWPTTSLGWVTMWDAPLLKTWSPMSVGSWALVVFGLCTSLSFLASLRPTSRFAHFVRRSWVGRGYQVIGSLAGFFIAAYTGSVLTSTNQPIWSDSVGIAALFLTSAASTSLALMLLIAHARGMAPEASLLRLERADLWVLALELVVFIAFLGSLGPFLIPFLNTTNGKIIVATIFLGVVVPLAVHLRIGGGWGWSMPLAAWLALVGGFFFRYGMIKTPPEILARGPSIMASFSPEDQRPRGGGPGADPNNRGSGIIPHSKLNEKP